MTRKNEMFQMAMCRACGHDLYAIRHGLCVGEIRCSNPSCKFATSTYEMGKTTNEGPVTAE